MPGDDVAPPGSARQVLVAVLVGLVVTGILGHRLVGDLGRLHTTGGWTVFALCLGGALLVGALVTSVAVRRPGGRALRRDVAPALAAAALVGAVVVPTAAVGTAELVACVRGQGIEVAVEFTGVEERRWADQLVGTYVVAGERHAVRVAEGDRDPRETAPGRYRVPWAGSDLVCGTDRDGDAPQLVLHLLGGVLAGAVAGGALAGAVRRRRRPGDESAGDGGSDRA